MPWKSGFIRRERSTTDRRRVLIFPEGQQIQPEILPHYAKQMEWLQEAADGFTAEELATVERFLTLLLDTTESGAAAKTDSGI
ncbi:MarR family winged helix-turn-helix transcriptional regulator [Arthrobacter sp. M4]|uniref:MarR family winged helix-turn-helix transcriptional regulator n=1 Tax=Arthrobacter sp. M4 TaxID=218160 RepID=UPI001CDD1115|nr:hypothetical protein [Arthrobacter sp. M4]MCA4134238.1 hypothetical protein [Arthrobacter sp. M4]